MFTVKPAVGAKGLSSRVHIGGAKPQARGAVRLSARAQPKTVALFDFFKKKDDEEEEPAPRSVRVRSHALCSVSALISACRRDSRRTIPEELLTAAPFAVVAAPGIKSSLRSVSQHAHDWPLASDPAVPIPI